MGKMSCYIIIELKYSIESNLAQECDPSAYVVNHWFNNYDKANSTIVTRTVFADKKTLP